MQEGTCSLYRQSFLMQKVTEVANLENNYE